MDYFFFQAEDGIRDYKVTGVQTCALPISAAGAFSAPHGGTPMYLDSTNLQILHRLARNGRTSIAELRSEERRVGKEWQPGRSAKNYKTEIESNHALSEAQ